MPVNTSLLRGSEASLQLSKIDSRAGNLGDSIFKTEYSIATVGRVTGVEVCVTTPLEPFHEIGSRQATQPVPGTINISGSVERPYINGALLRLLMGDLVLDPAAGDELQPNFNMTIDLTNVGSKDGKAGTKVIIK